MYIQVTPLNHFGPGYFDSFKISGTKVNDDSSLCYDVIIMHQKLKFNKFNDFSSDIDFNSKTDIFLDIISLVINQCEPRCPNGASDGHKVSASRTAEASEARL